MRRPRSAPLAVDVVAAALLAASPVACGGPEYVDVGQAPPTPVLPRHDVLVRNNCSEPVQIAVGARPPETGSTTLGAGRVERLRVNPQERVWLQVRGAWERRDSASAPEDGWVFEVRDDCATITGRRGPL